MKRAAALGACVCGLVASVYGCVGDDPAPVAADAAPDSTAPIVADATPSDATTAPDAATDAAAPDTSTPDAATDGRVPTCAGQPFGTPVALDTSQLAAALASTLCGPRVVGGNAYFSAVPVGSTEQQLFRATFTGGAVPALSNATVLAPPSSATVVEWAPTVSPDSSLLVFATGFPGPRQLAVATGAGGAFTASTLIASLSTAADESDPYFANARALYFEREDTTGAPTFEIYRSEVTAGVFAAPTKVKLLCPLANCGTPVVTPTEDLLLFAAWPGGGTFAPTAREASLVGTSAGAVIDHPELGARYPSWVSPDGCEVLLGGGGLSTITDIRYAKRTPR